MGHDGVAIHDNHVIGCCVAKRRIDVSRVSNISGLFYDDDPWVFFGPSAQLLPGLLV